MCHDSILKWLGRTGVLVLLLLFASQRADGQGRIYWTEPSDLVASTSSIKSSDLNGSSVSTVARGFYIGDPLHLDIDQETGWVYWTDRSTGQVSRSDPNGTDGGVFAPNVATPHGIAVDGVNGYVYWTTKYPGIVRARFDGSDYTEIAAHSYVMGLEISVEDDLIFWTHTHGAIYRAHLDGSDLTEISPGRRDLIADGLAVDGLHDRLYMPQGNVILRMDFEGAQIDTVVQASSGVIAVVVEPAANRLCWSQTGETAGSGAVMCAGTDGSNVMKILDLPGVPHGLAINRASRMIYLTLPGRIVRCEHDGSSLEDVVQAMAWPRDVAVDPSKGQIYWTEVSAHTSNLGLKRSSLDDGDFEDIEVDVPDYPDYSGASSSLALDLNHGSVYLGTTSHSTSTPGRIIMGPLDGPVDLVIQSAAEAAATDIEVDATNQKVLYVLSGDLWRQNLDGSEPAEMFSSVGSGIAVSPQYLYWLDLPSHSIRRGNLDGTEPVDLLTGVVSIGDVAVDASDRYLFWSTPGEHTIKRLEIGQSTVHEIVTADVAIGGLYVVSAPSNLTQIAPLNGAADLPTTVNLSWSRPPDAQRFDVQVASGANINDVIFAENTPHDDATFVAPFAESSYYWRVRSTGAGGDGPFTPYAKFNVGESGPLAATLVEPGEGETGVVVNPTFRWTKSPEAVYHHLQVADNSSFTNPLIDVDSLIDHFDIGETFAHETTYYWRVAGTAADGKFTFTAPHSFTTIVAAPQAITLLSPDASAEGVPAYATFSWQAASDAGSYRFVLASDSLFEQLLVDIETPATAFALETPLAYDTRYFWRACGVNEGGQGSWSEYRAFRTVIGTGIVGDGLPSVLTLGQNFPNPFSLSTQIRYDLPRPEHVTIVVFDALGREVERLVDSPQPAGSHVVTFDVGGRPGGLYFYRMRAGMFERNRGMVVVQ